MSRQHTAKGTELVHLDCGSENCRVARKQAMGHTAECAFINSDLGATYTTAALTALKAAYIPHLRLEIVFGEWPNASGSVFGDAGGAHQNKQNTSDRPVLDAYHLKQVIEESVARAVKKYKNSALVYKVLDYSLRVRVSVIKGTHLIPSDLQKALEGWVLKGVSAGNESVMKLWGEVKDGKVVAVCTGHCDSYRKGHYHPDALEALTIMCSSLHSVYVLVVYTDVRKPWSNAVLEADKVEIKLYTLRSGETLVMEGAAGQCATHIVFAPLGSTCFRIRTILLP